MEPLDKIISTLQLHNAEGIVNDDHEKNFELLKKYFDTEQFEHEEARSIAGSTAMPIDVQQYMAKLILDRKLLSDLPLDVQTKRMNYYHKVVLRAKDYHDFRRLIKEYHPQEDDTLYLPEELSN